MISAESRVLDDRTAALPLAKMLAAAAGFALALTIAAQVRIPLPFTPVPITLQTFVLYVGAAWLGPRVAFGGLAMYVGAALVGIPVLSGLRGGLAAFTGATGGYVIGWFLAALVVARLLDGERPGWGRSVGAMALGSAIILSCGALHLALLLQVGPAQAFLLGVAPFLPGDALKVLSASAILRWRPNPLSLR